VTLRGRITRLYEGSGLIVRCPECMRHILDNLCDVHGDVHGVYDLRVSEVRGRENQSNTPA
jgi:ssDNA-binding replication factor A large subunit